MVGSLGTMADVSVAVSCFLLQLERMHRGSSAMRQGASVPAGPALSPALL